MSLLTRRKLYTSLSSIKIGSEVPLASYITSVILIGFLCLNYRMWHWFVIPVFICGLLIGPDAIRWLKGEYDLFDPKGAVGVLGYHLFFLAPLLFILWDVDMLYVVNPPDWRPWVGYLSILNVVSLILYHKFQGIGFRERNLKVRTGWSINAERALPLFLVFCGIALFAQVIFFSQSGGINGLINRLAMVRDTGRNPATGLGLLQAAGNSLLIIVLIYLTLVRKKSGIKRSSFFTIIVLLFIFSITQFFVGGWETRTATVWSVVWFAGILHHFWRPISRSMVAIALVALLIFMYGYGFYKGTMSLGGIDALERLASGRVSLSELESKTNRNFQFLIITDLSRVDVQAYQLYKLLNSVDYDLRWGKTYVSAVTSMVPGWIWREKPLDSEKIVAGTDLMLGRGVYSPGNRFRNSSWVYGPAGEAMLNFGVFLIPIPFAVIGYLMGRYRRAIINWQPTDARQFLAPFVTILFLMAMSHDLVNIVALFFYKGSFTILLVLFSSRRYADKIT